MHQVGQKETGISSLEWFYLVLKQARELLLRVVEGESDRLLTVEEVKAKVVEDEKFGTAVIKFTAHDLANALFRSDARALDDEGFRLSVRASLIQVARDILDDVKVPVEEYVGERIERVALSLRSFIEMYFAELEAVAHARVLGYTAGDAIKAPPSSVASAAGIAAAMDGPQPSIANMLEAFHATLAGSRESARQVLGLMWEVGQLAAVDRRAARDSVTGVVTEDDLLNELRGVLGDALGFVGLPGGNRAVRLNSRRGDDLRDATLNGTYHLSGALHMANAAEAGEDAANAPRSAEAVIELALHYGLLRVATPQPDLFEGVVLNGEEQA